MNSIDTLSDLLRVTPLIPTLAVTFFSLRRLALSRSGNAWLYASFGLLGLSVAGALLPFVVLGDAANAPAAVMALILPLLWMGLVVICGTDGDESFDRYPAGQTSESSRSADTIDDVTPMFKHYKGQNFRDRSWQAERTGVLAAARRMRGNPTSDSRRPKALPAPDPDLPFLRF